MKPMNRTGHSNAAIAVIAMRAYCFADPQSSPKHDSPSMLGDSTSMWRGLGFVIEATV
ncbi:MAG: hypothetical protein QNK05_16830 [Myxococcota bacterium]|nr:hypothetical protein [Myxococcota bacterium]